MIEFKHEDYPALYQAADKVSNDIQATYMNLMRWNIFLLITAAIFSFIGITSTIMAIFAAIIFIITIIINVVLMTKNYHDIWYKARSIAESIKTVSWRFMMKAEPFSLTEQENNEKFRNIINKILQGTSNITEKFDAKYHSMPLITTNMNKVIKSTIEDKILIYLTYRIQEQRNWYAKKTKYNQFWYKFWFFIMIILQIAAITIVLSRIAYPEIKYLSPEILSVMITGILTWIQLKKYRELSASYSFTAHEIGIIESKIATVSSSSELSRFVQDAENAFSREHTQWVARKDH